MSMEGRTSASGRRVLKYVSAFRNRTLRQDVTIELELLTAVRGVQAGLPCRLPNSATQRGRSLAFPA